MAPSSVSMKNLIDMWIHWLESSSNGAGGHHQTCVIGKKKLLAKIPKVITFGSSLSFRSRLSIKWLNKCGESDEPCKRRLLLIIAELFLPLTNKRLLFRSESDRSSTNIELVTNDQSDDAMAARASTATATAQHQTHDSLNNVQNSVSLIAATIWNTKKLKNGLCHL